MTNEYHFLFDKGSDKGKTAPLKADTSCKRSGRYEPDTIPIVLLLHSTRLSLRSTPVISKPQFINRPINTRNPVHKYSNLSH